MKSIPLKPNCTYQAKFSKNGNLAGIAIYDSRDVGKVVGYILHNTVFRVNKLIGPEQCHLSVLTGKKCSGTRYFLDQNVKEVEFVLCDTVRQ